MSEANFIIRARDKSKEAFASVEGRLAKLQGAMKSLGMGNLLGGLGVAGLVAYGRSAINAADAVDNLAGQLNLGIESVQSMDVLMREAGMSGADLTSVMAGLQNKMAEALSGNKAAVAAFEALGISMERLSGLSPEQALEAVTAAMYRTQGSAGAQAAATDILGARSAKLQGVLMQLGAQGFDALNASMLKSGQIMDGDLVRSMDKMEEGLSRALRRMGNQGKSFFAEFLVGLRVQGAGIASFVRGDGWEAGAVAAYDQMTGGRADQLTVSPEERQNRQNEAIVKGAASSLGDEITAMLEASQQAAQGYLAQLQARLEAAQEMGGGVGDYGSAGGAEAISRMAQEDLFRNLQKTRDEERNQILKSIRDEIKNQQAGLRMGA